MNAQVETVLFSAVAVLFAAITLGSLTSLAFPAAPSQGEAQVSTTGNGMIRHG